MINVSNWGASSMVRPHSRRGRSSQAPGKHTARIIDRASPWPQGERTASTADAKAGAPAKSVPAPEQRRALGAPTRTREKLPCACDADAAIIGRMRRRAPGCPYLMLTAVGALALPGAQSMVARADDAAVAAASAAKVPGNAGLLQNLPQVIIIGNTPLAGFGLPLNEIPSNVQTADSAEMQRQQTMDVADYLNDNFSGISASDSAGSPFQIDIYYHGFAASPLLGTPEGLSVYVDGVRVNESFGDTVNWDLIPESAINTVSLISGSNPVFGLNTLGGALSIQTKSGRTNPGSEVEAYGGSFGRRSLQAETGGAFGHFDYFFTGNYFDENGWRDTSTTRVLQGFGKVGWKLENTAVDLSYTYADNFLYGDGATPLSMLYYRRTQTYTPDYTQNIMSFVNLMGTQSIGGHLLLTGNAFYRSLHTYVSNGNISDYYLESNYAGPPTDCMDPGADPATLAYCEPGQDATSNTNQRSDGFSLQLTDSQNVLGWKNQAILGLDYDDSKDGFAQNYQYGGIAPDHFLIYEPSPYNNANVITVSGGNRILGSYLTDTLSPDPLLHVTAAMRYNSNRETIDGFSVDTDPADYGSGFLLATSVAGDHAFTRLNPSLGLTITPSNHTTYYANYDQASRAPTVLELGCANPAVPCGLPDDFASDPGLKQVIAHTFEIGLRGDLADQALNWSADVFRTINTDDIQFIANATNGGYFDNVGSTRREGLDLALGGRMRALRWKLAYSHVDATFQSRFTVGAASNSTADANGIIVVRPGDRIPLVPQDTGRVILDYDLGRHLEVGADLIFVSGSYLHGNENNANVAGTTDAASGAYISPTGTGWIPSYALLDFTGTYRLEDGVEIFGRLVNALDKQYYTAGFLTQDAYDPNGTLRANPNDWTNENGVIPGAPRGIWAGVRVAF
jgi:outer membrane receptor protein involved in Fe transport